MQTDKANVRVLITGGAGFIGHHLIEALLRQSKFEIVLLDRLDTSGNLKRLTDLECWDQEKHRVKFEWHDLKAPISEQLSKRLGSFDVIFHLAAGTHVDRSIADPLESAMDNVIGTTNLLIWAKKMRDEQLELDHGRDLTAFFYFSTDEVFGPAPEGVEYGEWDRYNSGNPYAAAKAGGEEMALAFHNTYKLPVIITHTMNVFGERQHPEKFIPMTIRKILHGEKITIHSSPDHMKAASRFWIHARNVADALFFLLAHGVPGEKYNIVGEREVDVKEMAELIYLSLADIVPEDLPKLEFEMIDFHSSRPGHDMRYALSGKKMKALGWEPPKGFVQSLKKMVEWYVKHQDWL